MWQLKQSRHQFRRKDDDVLHVGRSRNCDCRRIDAAVDAVFMGWQRCEGVGSGAVCGGGRPLVNLSSGQRTPV